MKSRMKKYAVMLNEKFCRNTMAVSADKAINNVRYGIFREYGAWFNVPCFSEFDAVEL